MYSRTLAMAVSRIASFIFASSISRHLLQRAAFAHCKGILNDHDTSVGNAAAR